MKVSGTRAPGPEHPEEPGARAFRFAGVAVVLLAALIAVAPQLVRGDSCGHDFDFHLVSWFDAAQSWREGVVYPRWSPSANYGAGEPRFIFYPPVSWMLGAALGLALPWRFVPITLTFLVLAGTGLATRTLAREALPDGPATLAGCVSLFSGYALFTAYERSDFSELTGGFWIPLLLLFALRDRAPGATVWRRAFDGSAAPLALVVAGAWLSNPPLGVMTSYLLASVAMTTALLGRSWAPILRASVAVTVGLGITAIYLLPAAVEQRWMNVGQLLSDPGFSIEDNWLFARHSNPLLAYHDVELNRVSWIAITMIAVALAAVAACRARKRLPGRREWWIPLALIPVAVLFLLLPLSDPFWRAVPKLKFLQFPWRWLVVAQAPMGIFFASAMWTASRRWRVAALTACSAAFVCATLIAGLNFFQVCDDEDKVSAMLDVYRTGAGFEGTDEYTPSYADNEALATNLPPACLVRSADTQLGKGTPGVDLEWLADQGTCDATFDFAPGRRRATEHWRVAAEMPHEGFLILRLRSYPAWRIQLNGEPVEHLPERTDGLIAVPVAKGPADVRVDWTITSDVVDGRCLSAFALATLGLLFVLERRSATGRGIMK